MTQLVKAKTQVILTDAELDILNKTICKDLSREEIKLFGQVCQSKGLNPFNNQIYAIKRAGRLTFQTGIDGFRSIAEQTSEYEGQEDPMWYDDEGNTHFVWLKKEPPAACRVGIYRRGFGKALRATATFKEFYSNTNPLWRSMPAHMLAKCAEALALRKCFPQQLSGIYEIDEPIKDNKADNDKGLSDLQERIKLSTESDNALNELIVAFNAKCPKDYTTAEKKAFLKRASGAESFKDLRDRPADDLRSAMDFINNL